MIITHVVIAHLVSHIYAIHPVVSQIPSFKNATMHNSLCVLVGSFRKQIYLTAWVK